MKLIQKFKITILGLLLVGMAGCFPDNSRLYDGPLQVEFNPTSDTQRMSDGNTYNAKVQLVGQHQDSDITVNFEIDTENSTAVSGEHFEIDGLSFSIPANSSFGTINVSVIEENIDESRPVVVINLLGDESGKVKIAQNYRTFELTLRP